MKRLGKIIGILLAAVLSFGLAGCTAGGGGLGGTDDCNHARVSYRDGGSDFHYVTCDDCGVDLRSEAHRFKDGVCKDCGRPDEQPEEHVHKPQLVAGIQPDCEHEGREDYYLCSCGAMFRDPDGHERVHHIDELTLPKQHRNEWVPEIPSDCYTQGHQAYYECTSCGRWFWDFEGTNEIADHDAVLLPIRHEEYMLQSDETGHWQFCLKCNRQFDFAQHTFVKGVCVKCGFPEQEITTPHEHPLTRVEPKEPDCEHEGVREHYKCPTCKRVFDDPEGYNEISEADTVLPKMHDIRLVPEQEATCTEDGYAEHMECVLCSRWFYDWDGQSEIEDKTDLTYPAAHDFQPVTDAKTHCEQCSRCGATQNVGEHTFVDGVCSTCERGDGLSYTLRDDGTYAVSLDSYFWWEKTCDYIYIPSQYQGKTVTEIAQDAFNGRASLAEIVIPNTIQTIGMYAFAGCTALTEFTVPAGVTSFDASVLSGCVGLQRLSVAAGNATYYAEENCLIERETDTLVRGISTSVVPAGVKRIGLFAFMGCTDLTQIALPSDLTGIEDGAFEGCTNLTTVTLGGVLPWLTMSVFGDCPIEYTEYENVQYLGNANSPHLQMVSATDTDIASVSIPADTACIGANAFQNCASLSTLYIPAGIESIGYNAFANCTGLTSVTFAGTVDTVYGAFGFLPVETVTLPADMIPKTDIAYRRVIVSSGDEIPDNAFDANGHGSVTYIEFPATVRRIGANAFDSCKKLQQMAIPDGVAEIGAKAFYQCEGITRLTIPDSVVSVGTDAFDGCGGFDELTLPASALPHVSVQACPKITVTSGDSIPDNCFNYCTNLTQITLPEGLKRIGARAFGNCSALRQIDLPDTVTEIGESAFAECSALTSIKLPDGLKILEANTFYQCGNLTQVTLGAGLRSISPDAFSVSNALREIRVDDIRHWLGLEFSSERQNPLTSERKLYVGDVLLTALAVPEGVTEIGSYAFYGCTQLTGVTLADSVTEIGESAFENCTGLSVVSISDYVTEIGRLAFSGCSGLNVLELGARVQILGDHAFTACTGLTQIVLPNSVTTVGESAFSACIKVAKVTFGNSVRTVGQNAFFSCSVLTEVHIGAVADWLDITFGTVESNPLSATCKLYVGDSLLTSLAVPTGVTAVRDYAFTGAEQLLAVTFPETLLSIGTSAFSGCKNITEAVIPDSVTSVGAGAFRGNGLTSVTLGSGLTAVSAGLFENCRALKNITIPANITRIGRRAFYGSGLTQATLPEGLTTIEADAFNGCGLTVVSIPESVTAIGESAYHNCRSLKQLTVPDGADVDETAFAGCTAVERLTAAGSVVASIPKDAIKYLTVTSGSIPDLFFQNSTTLSEVTVGAEVTSLGNNAFYNCTALTTVYWNAVDCAVGDFYNCPKLTALHVGAEVRALPDMRASALTGVYITDLAAWVSVAFASADCNPLGVAHALYLNNTRLVNLAVPDGVETVADYAFYGSEVLTVSIPASVKALGDDVFGACSALTAINVDGNNTAYASQSGILYDKTYRNVLFAPLRVTGVIEMPTNLRSIPADAFAGRTSVTGVRVADVNTWAKVAFGNIDANPLYIAHKLYVGQADAPATALEVGGDIGKFAFAGCTGVTQLTLTNTAHIGVSAFEGWNNVTVYADSLSGWCAVTFDNPQANPLHGGNAVLYVKSGQASNQQVNEIPLGANIKDVGAYAFYNYKYLNTIEVNGKIGTEAFYGCEQLTVAWLGTSVKTVESKAFADSGLTTVSYRGTQAQWESITKAPDWVNDPAAVIVQYQA